MSALWEYSQKVYLISKTNASASNPLETISAALTKSESSERREISKEDRNTWQFLKRVLAIRSRFAQSFLDYLIPLILEF